MWFKKKRTWSDLYKESKYLKSKKDIFHPINNLICHIDAGANAVARGMWSKSYIENELARILSNFEIEAKQKIDYESVIVEFKRRVNIYKRQIDLDVKSGVFNGNLGPYYNQNVLHTLFKSP